MVPRDVEPGVELFVIYLLTMGPDGSTDPGDTVRRAERAIAALSPEEALGAQRYLGAAIYRAGRHAEAVSLLETSVRSGRPDRRSWDWAFLAMAHYRLGHDAEARHWLDHFHDRTPSDPATFRSPDDLEDDLLGREAEAIVRLDPAFPDDPFAP
jgi:hypothetical protein